MAGTILPIVYGQRQRGKCKSALWLHLVGCIGGASSIGVLLGSLGGVLPFDRHLLASILSLVLAGLIGLLYSSNELGLAHLPAPQSYWQVPSTWRSELPEGLSSLLYGLVLGVGVATRLPVTFYPVAVWAVLVGDPILAGLGMSAFGLGRWLPLALISKSTVNTEESLRLTITLEAWGNIVRFVNGLALSCGGSCLMIIAVYAH